MDTSVGRNVSFREEKKSYELKKKCFTKNIHSALETTHEVHSGWLKARTTFKGWTRVWCQVKPGYLILYTSQEAQKKHRLGVVLLSICQAIHRPTKKDGFCFKLINPFGCSVWAKSTSKAITYPQASLTLRSSDYSIGKVWLDSLQRCNLSANLDGNESNSTLLDSTFTSSTYSKKPENTHLDDDSDDGDSNIRQLTGLLLNDACNSTSQTSSLASFNNVINNNNNNDIDPRTSSTNGYGSCREKNTRCTGSINIYDNHKHTQSSKNGHEPEKLLFDLFNPNPSKNFSNMSRYDWKELKIEKVSYILDNLEDIGNAGVQSEEVQEGNKSLLWHIIKQLRPGMDLSKVTLPTFILEPRSFLEKLADYYYHCDILAEAALVDNPTTRLIYVVKWYISGFYKKPSGPKKPYNPILGEKFRCFWDNPKTQSRTFFLAEQISHHPPISAFHVTNRKDGYSITCALLSRSKFSGNSVSAILDGKARLYFHKRAESYTITMPYANCRGILLGSLCMELGGKVEIECHQTSCKCELDFRLAPVWANSNSYNSLTGKIYRNNTVTHTMDGHWDKRITIYDKVEDKKSSLWEVTPSTIQSRLKRYSVSKDNQEERESNRLWAKVTEALKVDDQLSATNEKTILEDMQRKEARERNLPHKPNLFTLVPQSGEWVYKWQDTRPWDEELDILQFEDDFKILTLVDNSQRSISFDPNLDCPFPNSGQSDIIDLIKSISLDRNVQTASGLEGGARHENGESSPGDSNTQESPQELKKSIQRLQMQTLRMKDDFKSILMSMFALSVAMMVLFLYMGYKYIQSLW